MVIMAQQLEAAVSQASFLQLIHSNVSLMHDSLIPG